MASKPTKIEYLERIRAVKKLLLIGKTRSDILQYASEKWGCEERPTDTLIATATQQILDITKDDTKMMLGKIVANQWEIYLEARNKKDLSTARQILMDISKLTGVSFDRIIHEHRELGMLTDEELRSLKAVTSSDVKIDYHN